MTGSYIVTAAQNATPVHRAFWRNLKAYASSIKAEIIVLPLRYKNPTSQWAEEQQNHEWWVSDVKPHLLFGRKRIHKKLVIMGDMFIQATATRPLSGLDTISEDSSAIMGHTKVELVSVPVPHGRLPKLLMTTGACTVPNYTESKTGKKAEHHHVMGATVVDFRGGVYNARQIVATSDGSFQDITDRVASGIVHSNARVEAIVCGDWHSGYTCPVVRAETIKMIRELQPRYLVLHDFLNFHSQSHHDRTPWARYRRWRSGETDVNKELMNACDELNSFVRLMPSDGRIVVVRSNHDEHFERWIEQAKDIDPCNARMYHEMNAAAYAKMEKNPDCNINMFEHCFRQKVKSKRVRFLSRDESMRLKGVEIGFHGDIGSNGARGSKGQFTRIGTRSVIGHSHQPAIMDGVYQVGTSSVLRIGYNKGPSSWLNSHCVVYPNGKRTLYHIVRDGK